MLYIFSSTDKLLTVLSEDTGLIETHFKDYQNLIQDETFTFSVHQSKKYSQSYDTFYNLTQVAGSFIGTIDEVESTVNVSPIEFVEEENQVAFYDKDNELRLMRMKELIEITEDGQSIIKVICEPAYLELYDHFIEDKRIVDGTAQLALNRALEGSRYIGEVTLDLGNATDNFYWIDGVEAVFSILDTWGGALKDTITLDDNNNIIERKLWINARLGADNGLIVEPDYNAESIERKTLSYIETALWGQGSSLEIEDEHGELTGGHTRYITFEDVVWSTSKGDPANKPKGQKWIGDEDARLEHGYIHNGVRKHRFGHFSNQDYETPEELLMATWQELQERKLKEVVHEASIYEDEKGASLGDTVTILNREYSKPIELQSQITGLEYDLLYPKELDIIIGKYIDMSEDPLQKEVDDLKVQAKKPPKPITDISFPDIVPGTPVNVSATGAFQTIQLFWDYDSKVYISHYEVYGSQISDFIPDEQQLLYRGRVSAFSHEVSTDEKWYYYVRAVNTRGTVGEFSERVSASTVRIMTDDMLFGSVTADLLEENLDLANKLSDGTLEWINEEPLHQINETENRILTDVGNRITDILDDVDLLDGKIVDVEQYVDAELGLISNSVASVRGDLDIVTGEVNHQSTEISNFNQRADNIELSVTNVEGDLSNAWTEIGLIDVKSDNISLSINELEGDLENWGVGNRNLFSARGLRNIISTHLNENTIPIMSDKLAYKRHVSASNIPEFRILFYDSADDLIKTTIIPSTITEEVVSAPSDAVGVRFVVSGDLGIDDIAETILSMKIKVEEGSEHTAYSPAIEDVVFHNPVSYINLSNEGVRIGGDKVHISGQTLIDEAVIGTAAIANLAVDRFHLKYGIIDNVHIADATIEHGKMKSLNVDHVVAGQMDLNYLKAGTIDTDKIKIRGGSAVDYISIDGNDIRTHGQFTRTWGGETDTARLRLGLFGGRVRVTNDDTGYNLYMTEKGLSTTMAGASEISAGTLEFHSQRYSSVARGVTMHSTYGAVAMVSDYSTAVIDTDLSVNLNSAKSGIYLRPMRDTRAGTNEFVFRVKDSQSGNSWMYTDGWIAFGDVSTSSYHSGLRFSKDSGLYTIYATNGNGDIGTGRFDAASVRANLVARGTNGYAMVESGGQFRVTDMKGYNDGSPVYADMQVDRIQARSIRISSAVGQNHFFVGASSGELRVMNNLFEGYRPVRASSFPTGSSEIYKSDIKLYEDSALDILRNSVVYDYIKDGVPNRELGFIIEREFPDIIKHDDISINGYSHSSLNTKAIQELDKKLLTVDDRLNEKDLQIQYLQDKIKQLECAI